MEDHTNPELEVVKPDALEAIERAQIDMAVATAKRYPREVSEFLMRAKSAISASKQIAESCRYRLKRMGKDGKINWIEGPSIRLMEIAAVNYGNLKYGSRQISEDNRFVECQGVASDMEMNVHIFVTVKRRITTSAGRKYSDDMVMVTSNAAGSIARRNALKGVIPGAYLNELEMHAKKLVQGDSKTLPDRLKAAAEKFKSKYNVSQQRLLAYLERPKMEDCTLDDLDKLIGTWVALEDGEYKVDEIFLEPGRAPKMETKSSEDGKKEEPEAPELFEAGKSSGKKKKKQEEEPIVVLKKLAQEEGIEEGEIVDYLHKIAAIDDSLGTLEEVNTVVPSAITSMIEGWKVFAKKMVANRGSEKNEDDVPYGDDE